MKSNNQKRKRRTYARRSSSKKAASTKTIKEKSTIKPEEKELNQKEDMKKENKNDEGILYYSLEESKDKENNVNQENNTSLNEEKEDVLDDINNLNTSSSLSDLNPFNPSSLDDLEIANDNVLSSNFGDNKTDDIKSDDLKETNENNLSSKLDNIFTGNSDEYKKYDFSNSSSDDNNDSNNNSNNKSKFYLSYERRLGLNIIAIIILIFLSITMFILSITVSSRSTIAYNENNDLNYNITLKENDYYNDSNLNNNMQYIASLIDDVNVSFNYNFNASEAFDYTYTYYIKSEVRITDNEDTSRVIYSKVDKLTSESTVTNKDSRNFNINQSVSVNYSDYNDLAKQFKSTYGISADSNLILSLCLEIKDQTGNVIRSIDTDNTMTLTIPLTEQLVHATSDYKKNNKISDVTVYQDFSITNKFSFILSIIILLSAIVSIVNLVIFVKKTTKKKTIYEITLQKILREYDRVIVNSKKAIDVTGDVIDVNSFNELLDVRDNIEKPIIFYELHKGQKSVFIVRSDTGIYRYILKLFDLEK